MMRVLVRCEATAQHSQGHPLIKIRYSLPIEHRDLAQFHLKTTFSGYIVLLLIASLFAFSS